MTKPAEKPLVLITGAAGSIGSELAKQLSDDFRVVGLDVEGKNAPCPLIAFDLTDAQSVRSALEAVRADYGNVIAAVVHLAAFFDFSGADSPLYQSVNVEGTQHLLEALQGFEVGRFIYASTMLVHRPCRPGERIDEDTAIDPGWAYPVSKAQAEQAIMEARGDIPTLILRLAGLYDADKAVPTLSHQIARIHARGFKSHLHSGDPDAGQSFIHKDDMMRLFRAAIDRRDDLPQNLAILAGEEEAVSFRRLQDRIGQLVHGEETWQTPTLPAPIAKLGAKIEVMSEPVVPDDFD